MPRNFSKVMFLDIKIQLILNTLAVAIVNKAVCDEEAEFHSTKAIYEVSSSKVETGDDAVGLSSKESSELLTEVNNAEGIQSNTHTVGQQVEIW